MTAKAGFPAGTATSWGSWLKAWEIAVAAPMVIGMRTARMVMAGPNPKARDRREVRRMGQEKVDVWWDGLMGSAAVITATNLQLAGMMMRAATAGVAPLSQMAAAVPAQLCAAVLDPVHSRVRANQRRLATARRS